MADLAAIAVSQHLTTAQRQLLRNIADWGGADLGGVDARTTQALVRRQLLVIEGARVRITGRGQHVLALLTWATQAPAPGR